MKYLLLLSIFILFNCMNAFLFRPRLVFNENFNGNQLNTRFWEYGEGCSNQYGGEVLNCWIPGTNNVQVQNGHLTIRAKIEKHGDYNYTSGVIRQKRGFKYGYFVSRAKMPKGKHFWPAIWLLNMPMNNEGCRSEEIDIIEYRGQEPEIYHVAAHYGRIWPKIKSTGAQCGFNVDMSKDFHEYGVDWRKDKLTYFFDNKKCFEVALDDGLPEPKWKHESYEDPCTKEPPFSDPSKFIFSLAIGGVFFNKDDKLTEEEARRWEKPTYEIDWVRIYQ